MEDMSKSDLGKLVFDCSSFCRYIEKPEIPKGISHDQETDRYNCSIGGNDCIMLGLYLVTEKLQRDYSSVLKKIEDLERQTHVSCAPGYGFDPSRGRMVKMSWGR